MSPLLGLALVPLLLVGVVAGLRRPLGLLLPAYAASVPFGSLLSTGLSPPYDSISTPLGMLLIVGLGSQAIFGRTVGARFPRTVPVWLLYLGVAGMTAAWSVSAQLTEVAFRNLALLVILYFLVSLTPLTIRELRRVETGLVVGGVTAACYGIFQFVTGTLPVDPEAGDAGRFGRDLLGANNTAAALLVPFAIAWCRAAAGTSPLGRRAHAAAVGTILFGILLTGSRGGLLATAVCIGVAIAFTERGRASMIRFAATTLVVASVVLVVQPGGIAGRTDSTSSSGRSDVWKVGLYACRTYCVQGSGWGTFARVYQQEQPKVRDARVLGRGVAYEAHNIFLLIAIEAGLAGLALALIGFVLTMREGLRLPRYLRAPPLAGVISTLAAGFFLSNFEYKFFWMMLMYPVLCRNADITSLLDRRARPDAPLLALPTEWQPARSTT